MELSEEFKGMLEQPESETLEYKAVLIPSRGIAQLLSAFANTKGGYLIFGVTQTPSGQREIRGLSEDFKVTGMIHKALDLLNPRPTAEYAYFTAQGLQLFGVKVAVHDQPVYTEGKLYIRAGDRTLQKDPPVIEFKGSRYSRLGAISEQFKMDQSGSTAAKFKFLDHYLNVLKLYEEAHTKIFPIEVTLPTTIPEGKILNRILFSSCIDNFETYLSDLLYEIYLANPNTLRGGEAMVRVSDVLDCADRDEFIKFYAGRRIRKLQKGSVKGFIKENKEIANLQAISDPDTEDIERTLQIRHLYAHRNGIVDESFLAYFPGAYPLNGEHVLNIEEVFDKLTFLATMVNTIDEAAIKKYFLSTVA